jgi:hypothetical protein
LNASDAEAQSATTETHGERELGGLPVEPIRRNAELLGGLLHREEMIILCRDSWTASGARTREKPRPQFSTQPFQIAEHPWDLFGPDRGRAVRSLQKKSEIGRRIRCYHGSHPSSGSSPELDAGCNAPNEFPQDPEIPAKSQGKAT